MGGVSLREGRGLRRGVVLRCANPRCSAREHCDVLYPARVLGTFFAPSRAFLKCGRCKSINRINVYGSGAYSIEIEPQLVECPEYF